MVNIYNQTAFVEGVVKYKDVDMSFTPHPISGDITAKTNNESIKQSIKNLIFTRFGDKGLRYNFGSRLESSLFEQIDHVTRYALENELKEILTNYEPRVTITEVKVSEAADYNTVSATIKYNINNVQDTQTLTTILFKRR